MPPPPASASQGSAQPAAGTTADGGTAAAAAAKVPESDDEMDGKGGTAIDVDSLFADFDCTGTAEEIKGRLREKMADVEAFRKKSRLH